MIQEDYEKLVEHIAGINNDYKIVVEDVDLDSYDDEPKEKNSRQEIRDAIKPQVDIASSLITTIKDGFADKVNTAKIDINSLVTMFSTAPDMSNPTYLTTISNAIENWRTGVLADILGKVKKDISSALAASETETKAYEARSLIQNATGLWMDKSIDEGDNAALAQLLHDFVTQSGLTKEHWASLGINESTIDMISSYTGDNSTGPTASSVISSANTAGLPSTITSLQGGQYSVKSLPKVDNTTTPPPEGPPVQEEPAKGTEAYREQLKKKYDSFDTLYKFTWESYNSTGFGGVAGGNKLDMGDVNKGYADQGYFRLNTNSVGYIGLNNIDPDNDSIYDKMIIEVGGDVRAKATDSQREIMDEYAWSCQYGNSESASIVKFPENAPREFGSYDYYLYTDKKVYPIIADKSSIQKGAFTGKEPLSKYDTGGYTGAWGPEGRLAMLHQKEIVLNASDTENMLAAVDILRQVVQQIDLQAAAASHSLFAQAPSISSTGDTIQQEVTIHAEFPNATNHSEIEEAFDTLINRAAQYTSRKRY